MVDSKRYNPTITRFQKHTKNFVSGKTKKGHLNDDERDPGDYIKEEGTLVRISKKNIRGKGWEVKVDNKVYKCSYYGNSFLFLPNCTEDNDYYLPKKEYKVEVSIDKKSKIYTITKIKGLKLSSNEQLISIIEGDKINIQGGKKTSVEVGQEETSITGDKVNIQGGEDSSITMENGKTSVTGSISVEGDVKLDTSEEEGLPDEISVKALYKKVQIIEEKISDNDDS